MTSNPNPRSLWLRLMLRYIKLRMIEPLFVKKQLMPIRDSSSSNRRPFRWGTENPQEQVDSKQQRPNGSPRGAPITIKSGLRDSLIWTRSSSSLKLSIKANDDSGARPTTVLSRFEDARKSMPKITMPLSTMQEVSEAISPTKVIMKLGLSRRKYPRSDYKKDNAPG